MERGVNSNVFEVLGATKSLLLGCGSNRQRKMGKSVASNLSEDDRMLKPFSMLDWDLLTTLDINPCHNPDVVWDAENIPLPFGDEEFDEIHAYDVLEHTGNQGDWRFFFDQWTDFHRILKPNGWVCGICPRHDSIWAWGDPSHKRVLTHASLVFLDQDEYVRQVGDTAMSDYRSRYRVCFKTRFVGMWSPDQWCFAVQKA